MNADNSSTSRERAISAAATSSSMATAATDGANNNRSREGSIDEYSSKERSGDTPPPPEKKKSGFGSKTNSHNISAAVSSPMRRNSNNSGPTRFQFYVPTTDYAAIGSSSNKSDALSGGGSLPDPPSAAEESARRARSRLIQIQSTKQSFSSSSPAAAKTAATVQDSKSEEDDYSKMNFDPIESDEDVNPKDSNVSDDDDDIVCEDDDIPNSSTVQHVAGRPHRIPPQQLMKQLHEGRGAFGTRPSTGDVHKRNRGVGNHSSSFSGSGVNYHQSAQQQQFHHSSPQLVPKMNRRRQSENLYSDGIDMLETAASEAREREEIDTLNESISYLRNLQLSSDAKTKTTPSRIATPIPPSQEDEPRFQYIPTNNSDNDDVLRTRSNSLDGGSEMKTTSGNQNHNHHRPIPPHQPQQQMQYRETKSVPSTPASNRRNRPKITAAEAMDFVMNASSARLGKYKDDSIEDDVHSNEGEKALDRMKAFVNTISRVDEVPLRDEADVESPTRRSSSIRIYDYEDSGDEMIEDDFEQSTSLSMHAEVKSPSTASRYNKNKHTSMTDDASSHLERLTFDDRQNSLMLDDEESDATTSPRRDRNLDPPDHDGFGSTQINPSVLPLQTTNARLYGVEAVIPSSSFDDEISRPPLKDARGPVAALGPRSKRPGGITGVVLDAGLNESEKYRPQITTERDVPSSYGRGIDPQDTVVENRLDSETEKILSREDIGDVNRVVNLCSHLLPIGFNSFFGNDSTNDDILRWDDDDPDESGYIVHRMTESELFDVEDAFEKIVKAFEESSVHKVRSSTNDANFERDLKEAEMILDQEEARYEAEIHAARYSTAATSSEDDSDDSGRTDDTSFRSANSLSRTYVRAEDEERTCVPDFPGIFSPGQGKVGEMECFYLPIITKSQKTGFEPTKDLVLKPGSVFANNYLVQSELGSAAFSTAYRCIDLSSEEDDEGYQDEVCLKVIKNTKDYFDQSLDEIKILQLLKDTGRVRENNIVEMRSFFYHREHLVIVTELLRQNLYEFGKSIRESRGPAYFTRQRLSHIARQCLVALKFVHELGLMHCDIKPENILLGSYSRALVKVIDFGSSSYVTDRQSSYIQSRSYRAPEVILGLPYGGKIDMWSLGCVLAEMYTGEVTFQNDSEVSMLSRIEAICGPFPRHMIAKGRNCHRIFTDSGLIFEKAPRRDAEDSRSHSGSDDGGGEDVFDVYQPKVTTIAARLGFAADFLDQPKLSEGDEQRALFIDFVSKMLTIDPDLRPSAEDALQHPWILSSLDLTEDDILYPPNEE